MNMNTTAEFYPGSLVSARGREWIVLCDFVADTTSIAWALNKASDFCGQHGGNAEAVKLAWGALHWHTFAQLYEHEFERFDAQYKALDACYKLTVLTQGNLGKPTTERGHAAS